MITKEQCAAARGLLGADTWTQHHLADKSGLSESSVRNFEKGRGTLSEKSLQAIVDALKAAGIKFIPGNGEGPGVRIAKGSGKHPDPSATIPVVKAKKRAKATKGRTK